MSKCSVAIGSQSSKTHTHTHSLPSSGQPLIRRCWHSMKIRNLSFVSDIYFDFSKQSSYFNFCHLGLVSFCAAVFAHFRLQFWELVPEHILDVVRGFSVSQGSKSFGVCCCLEIQKGVCINQGCNGRFIFFYTEPSQCRSQGLTNLRSNL